MSFEDFPVNVDRSQLSGWNPYMAQLAEQRDALLDACKVFLSLEPSYRSSQKMEEMIAAAIAKAEAQQ